MYHILKIGSAYVGPNGETVYDRASALHVDAGTVRAMKGAAREMITVPTIMDDLRLVTVTTRADRAARNGVMTPREDVDVFSTSDPQSAR